MTADDPLLASQLTSLLEDEPDAVANLSNAAALLNQQLEGLNWAGFYLVKPASGSLAADPRGNQLVLGPFQGKPACIRLPYGKGVCGTAWATRAPVRVDDVHRFAGHIACDSDSRSELVVPLFGSEGEVWGVLDLDSPVTGRFTAADQAGLENFCRILEARVTRP